jgi:hypothetical protein
MLCVCLSKSLTLQIRLDWSQRISARLNRSTRTKSCLATGLDIRSSKELCTLTNYSTRSSSLFTDVTQRIYVVTHVSEQPFDPIFKGQALVFLALVWYLVTDVFFFRGNPTVPSLRVKQSSLLGHGLATDVSGQPTQPSLGHELVVTDVSGKPKQ